MTREDDVLRVLYAYVDAGLIERSVEHALACLTDDIMGFGMGEQGFVCSKEQVAQILREGAKTEPGVSHSVAYEQVDIRFPEETVASVCARITILRKAGDSVTKSGLMQSATMRLTGEGWRICAVHASPVLLSEESIEAYPLRYAENTLTHLKEDLQRETFELMNQSISGGILSCYCDEVDRFPLYFVNDSMLQFLDYTREEFVRRFGGNVLLVIHEEDRDTASRKALISLARGEDYQIRQRMIRRDGSACWMMVRARKGVDEAGAEVIIGVFMDITEMVELQDRLEEQTVELEAQAKELSVSEERFRIALEKTSNIIFDYDIISGNIMHSSVPKRAMDFVTSVDEAQDTLIIGGRVTDAYLGEFQKAFAEVRDGAVQSSCTVKVRLATGKEVWNRVSLTGITDNAGHTVRAIGMIEDITRQKEAEIAYAREEQYRQAILADAMASYVVNYSKGVFESCTVSHPHCLNVMPGDPYDTVLLEETRYRFIDDERRAYLNLFSSAAVIERYQQGETECSLEYRVIYGDGTDMWMRTTLHLVLDSVTNELKGFMYVTDIDKKKREELELTRKSQQDSLTGVYNKGAAMIYINEALKTFEGLQSGVFMMLDVDYFKSVNDKYGHPAGDGVLIAVTKALRDSFREQDIVGRLGGDEFCVFFSGMRSRDRVRQAAADICRAVREIEIPGAGTPVTCSIGITVCGGFAKTFAQVYQEADQALYYVKEHGRDGYAFFDEAASGG